MSAVLEVRRLKARRKVKKSGMPWWLIGVLGVAVLGSLAGVIGLGGAYAYYQSYARDFVPISERLQQTSRGLTEIYDRSARKMAFCSASWRRRPRPSSSTR